MTSELKTTGVLNSPYGKMTVGDDISSLDIPNGWRVENGKLVGILFNHEVPTHWVTSDAELEQARTGK